MKDEASAEWYLCVDGEIGGAIHLSLIFGRHPLHQGKGWNTNTRVTDGESKVTKDCGMPGRARHDSQSIHDSGEIDDVRVQI
jgi:hypothetical protein